MRFRLYQIRVADIPFITNPVPEVTSFFLPPAMDTTLDTLSNEVIVYPPVPALIEAGSAV